MHRLALVTGLVTLLFACEEESPCDRWADYVCTCHDGEEGFDCEELQRLAEDPTPAVEEQCQIDLSEQRSVDQDAGEFCPV